jgi:cell volume regulation protein A
LVGYSVAANSPYLRRGLIPSWAKPTLFIREERILTPEEATEVKAGDYVYLLAPPEKAQALDRFFVDLPPPRAPDPRLLGDFFVPGTATLGALADIYGLQIAADHMEFTLADQFAEELKRPAKQGDIIHIGPIALLAHAVSKGKVTTVGLQLAEPDEDDALQHRFKAVMAKVRKLLRLDRAS